jgi:hypothetical protein
MLRSNWLSLLKMSRDKIYIHLFIELNILTSRDASSSVSAPANPRTGLPFADTCCKLRPSPSAQVTHTDAITRRKQHGGPSQATGNRLDRSHIRGTNLQLPRWTDGGLTSAALVLYAVLTRPISVPLWSSCRAQRTDVTTGHTFLPQSLIFFVRK